MNQKLEDLFCKLFWGVEELIELVIVFVMLYVDYLVLVSVICSLIYGEIDEVVLMVMLVCEIYYVDDRFDWIGFYCVIEFEVLKIGFYQGGYGCLVILFVCGVCGVVVCIGQIQFVLDVDVFFGYIVCVSSMWLELVILVFGFVGCFLGVFDIDSNQFDVFIQDDVDQL